MTNDPYPLSVNIWRMGAREIQQRAADKFSGEALSAYVDRLHATFGFRLSAGKPVPAVIDDPWFAFGAKSKLAPWVEIDGVKIGDMLPVGSGDLWVYSAQIAPTSFRYVIRNQQQVLTDMQAQVERPADPPEMTLQPNVPVGEITKHSLRSRIFPNTHRDYYIYVPRQYDPAKPTCVMIFHDGKWHVGRDNDMRIPNMLDNLIHQKDIPPMIGLFVDFGFAIENGQVTRHDHRGVEYERPTDEYARMLIEEILPEVASRYNIRPDGPGRGICGASSGAVCAFNAAWHRPDAFGKVLSWIGSYTNMRGGHLLAQWVRLAPPKPIKVSIQAGENDLNINMGHWYLANLELKESLEFSGYDVRFKSSKTPHSGKPGAADFPDAMRWLWKEEMGIEN